jgi:hypothetical protein
MKQNIYYESYSRVFPLPPFSCGLVYQLRENKLRYEKAF